MVERLCVQGPRPPLVLFKIAFQTAKCPGVLETKMCHVPPGFLRRHFPEINLVQSSDQAGAIPADIAVKIDRQIAFVPQNMHDLNHVLFRRRTREAFIRAVLKNDGVMIGFSFFRSIQERMKLQLQNTFDVFGLKKFEIRVIFRPGASVHAVIHLREADNGGSGRRMSMA